MHSRTLWRWALLSGRSARLHDFLFDELLGRSGGRIRDREYASGKMPRLLFPRKYSMDFGGVGRRLNGLLPLALLRMTDDACVVSLLDELVGDTCRRGRVEEDIRRRRRGGCREGLMCRIVVLAGSLIPDIREIRVSREGRHHGRVIRRWLNCRVP